MADGVAEVEERALATLLLIGGDDPRLQPDRSFDQGGKCAGISSRRAIEVAFGLVEQISALEQRAFDHLREAAPQFPLR